MTEDQVEELMAAQRAEMRAAFDLFDADGDGQLDAVELGRALRLVGQPATPGEVRRLLATFGRGDGLDFAGFVALVEPRPEGLDPEADAREAFQVLDADGDGVLTREELEDAARRHAFVADPDALVAAADANGDGVIDWAEFRALYGRSSSEVA